MVWENRANYIGAVAQLVKLIEKRGQLRETLQHRGALTPQQEWGHPHASPQSPAFFFWMFCSVFYLFLYIHVCTSGARGAEGVGARCSTITALWALWGRPLTELCFPHMRCDRLQLDRATNTE